MARHRLCIDLVEPHRLFSKWKLVLRLLTDKRVLDVLRLAKMRLRKSRLVNLNAMDIHVWISKGYPWVYGDLLGLNEQPGICICGRRVRVLFASLGHEPRHEP